MLDMVIHILKEDSNMIVGTFTFHNEADLLVYQFESLLGFCDKIICQSDNSTPDCMDIANSYVDDKHIILLKNIKSNNFYERDERGDRERLLIKTKEVGGTVCFHTDVDEIVSINSIPKIQLLLKSWTPNIYSFYRYDFWHNARNYRLNYDTNNKTKEIINKLPPCIYDYIFPVTDDLTYGSSKIPNFHTPRMPNNISNSKVLINDIKILHFGYYKSSLIKSKGEFYTKDNNVTGHVWNSDMNMSLEEFKNRWGIGLLTRTGTPNI